MGADDDFLPPDPPGVAVVAVGDPCGAGDRGADEDRLEARRVQPGGAERVSERRAHDPQRDGAPPTLSARPFVESGTFCNVGISAMSTT